MLIPPWTARPSLRTDLDAALPAPPQPQPGRNRRRRSRGLRRDPRFGRVRWGGRHPGRAHRRIRAGGGTGGPRHPQPGRALAYRLNLYNAGALAPARRAFDATEQTVLRMPGGFSEPFVEVAGRGEAATHRQQTRSRCGLPLVRRVASGRATSSSRRPSPRRYGAPPGRCTPAPCRTRCSDARLRRPLRPQTRIR